MFRYPNLIKLNGTDLTDESRQPLEEDRDERSTVVDLASGRKRKFIKGIKRKWTINWENVGLSASHTVDANGGRNEIRAIAQMGGTIAFRLQDSINGYEDYTVFVDSYTETLIMRRNNNFRYSITLSLLEQG